MPFTDTPWSSPESKLSPEDFAKVCLIDETPKGKPKEKKYMRLPIRSTPGGPINKNAVHAAAGAHGIQGVKGVSPAAKKAAARKLISLYREMGEEPPESLFRIAGEKPTTTKKG